MSPLERRLPLFPLKVVLFPHASLPLHIFEERYKLMIQRCLDGDSQFGVVFIRSGAEVGGPAEPHSVGTVAGIERVERLDDGRLLITVKGVSRFRVKEITQSRPYLEGQVEVLEDEGDVGPPSPLVQSIRDAVTRHIRLLMGLRGGWVRQVKAPVDPAVLSYFVATILRVNLAEKQALLEEPSAGKRLETELGLLEREAEELRARVERELRRRVGKQ